MTNEQLTAGKELQEQIIVCEWQQEQLSGKRNDYGIPEEMHERQKREIQAWLGEQVVRLRAAFAAL